MNSSVRILATKEGSAKYNQQMNYFALVPAAGGGARMGAQLPKQYLPLLGRPLIYHTLQALSAHDAIQHITVVIAAEDCYWERFDWREFSGRLSVARCGGATRAQSVANGLGKMQCDHDDWVLVHDAARVCLTLAHLEKLINEIGDDAIGGLLAVPLADSLKRANADARITASVPREQLWQAQTPQMFRYSLLRHALAEAAAIGLALTDEAGALEALGMAPRLVAADATNLKVTYPLDLYLAELILTQAYPHDRHLADLRLREAAQSGAA